MTFRPQPGSGGRHSSALEMLFLDEPAAGPDGVQRLAEGLGAGALSQP